MQFAHAVYKFAAVINQPSSLYLAAMIIPDRFPPDWILAYFPLERDSPTVRVPIRSKIDYPGILNKINMRYFVVKL